MRTDTIVIGGQNYSIKGLTVSQALNTDLENFEARQAKDRTAVTNLRMKRMALCLQNGKAFIPDPANPNGQICAASMNLDAVSKWLDSDVFDNMLEFYEAEKQVLALADPVPAAKQESGKGVGEAVGESPAPE